MTSRLEKSQARRLGAQLKLARLERAMSLIDVAATCDIHHSQLSRLERGHFKRIGGNLQIVCRYLQISPHAVIASSSAVAQLHARLDTLVSDDPRNAEILSALLDALDVLRSPKASAT